MIASLAADPSQNFHAELREKSANNFVRSLREAFLTPARADERMLRERPLADEVVPMSDHAR